VRPSRISDIGHGPLKGPLLGTNPAKDREALLTESVSAAHASSTDKSDDDHPARRRRGGGGGPGGLIGGVMGGLCVRTLLCLPHRSIDLTHAYLWFELPRGCSI